MQNDAAANDNGTPVQIAGLLKLTYSVVGTFTATVNFEGSADGANYRSLDCMPITGAGRLVASTNVVQITGEANGSVHPAIKVKNAAGADNVRRRLSSIFQRLIDGIWVRIRRPLVPRTCPMIHGSNCQSPRAQRCWRAASTA